MVMIKEKWSGGMLGAARWQTDDAKHHMPSGSPKLYVASTLISVARLKRKLCHRLGLSFVGPLGITVWNRRRRNGITKERPTCPSFVCVREDVTG